MTEVSGHWIGTVSGVIVVKYCFNKGNHLSDCMSILISPERPTVTFPLLFHSFNYKNGKLVLLLEDANVKNNWSQQMWQLCVARVMGGGAECCRCHQRPRWRKRRRRRRSCGLPPCEMVVSEAILNLAPPRRVLSYTKNRAGLEWTSSRVKVITINRNSKYL